MKTCRECGETKPLHEFHIDRQKKAGRRANCAVCATADAAVRRDRVRGGPAHPRYARAGRKVMVPGAITLAKTCTQCGHLRQASDFTRSRHTSDGLINTCRSCSRKRWERPEVRVAARRAQLMRFYGLTPEVFDQILIQQSGRCSICCKPLLDDLRVDHDHETGVVRGLLCDLCNLALGLLGDDPVRVRAAAVYLERGADAVVGLVSGRSTAL